MNGSVLQIRLRAGSVSISHSPCDTEVFEVQRHAFRIALQPASLLFLDERDRVALVNVESVWAERSNRVGKLRGKTLTPTAEALIPRRAD